LAAKIELRHKVHVLTKKEELDSVRLPGKVVVVLDIIFATTTMVAALAHGAKEIVPVLDEKAARAACCPASSMPRPCPASRIRRRSRWSSTAWRARA
jgi:hypothetical protein